MTASDGLYQLGYKSLNLNRQKGAVKVKEAGLAKLAVLKHKYILLSSTRAANSFSEKFKTKKAIQSKKRR